MNPFEMVVLIVAIVTIGGMFRARHGGRRGLRGETGASDAEAHQMREEIRALKERIAVLERVITDTNSTAALDREIEKLR